MITALIVVGCIFIYSVGFIVTAFLTKTAHRPMESPVPLMWPIALPILICCSPFIGLYHLTKYLDKRRSMLR